MQDTPKTLEQIVAREAIRHLLSVYNTSGDRGRLTELADTFCEDGILDTGRDRFVGREAIERGLGTGLQRRRDDTTSAPSYVRHHLTTTRIELELPTRANGWIYFIVYSDHGPDHCGTYVDQYRNTPDGWRIAERRVKIHWDSPDTVLHAAMPEHLDQ